MFCSQKLTQVYSLYEWEDVEGQWQYQNVQIQQMKSANQQSSGQDNGKINEGQTMYGIVNFYLFFQLFVRSFQQVHKKSDFESIRFGITSSTVDYVCRWMKAWL